MLISMNNQNAQLGIERTLLFNKSYYEISENFICMFCEKLSVNPKACRRCKSVACEFCMKQKTKCLKCATILDGNLVQLSNRELSVLDEIKMRCSNLKLGCTETLLYKDYQNHKNSCKYSLKHSEKVKVIAKPKENKSETFKDIGIQVMVFDKDVNCPICKKSISKNAFTDHNEGICFDKMLMICEKQSLLKYNLDQSNNIKINQVLSKQV